MESLREQLLILISTPLYVVVIAGEMLLSHYRHTRSYTVKDTLTNLYLMLLNSGIDLLFRAVYLVVFQWLWEHRWYEFSTPFWYWFWLVVGMDFLYYWLHRVDHFSRFFWAVHVTHHSSEQFNLTVGFRSSVFQPLYRFIYFIPLALAGFKPLDIIFIFAATQIWGILVHTEHVNKLGWLEYILVTPSHHRVHHASNVLYLDKNLGMFLIIWDKMFGTFQPELPATAYQPLRYGLTKPLEKKDAFHIVFHEWIQIFKDLFRKDKPLWSKIWYVFGPPGWSHDGSTLTSEQMREKERKEGVNR
ncbi:MAG: sterol desaturase family protein [Saprospiraceae bacterium]|nr:sterol desaturase family protein [Saprospiraceae bacterium]